MRIVAPFLPGGPSDVLARTVAERYQHRTGQTVVVDNRPGGAGNIGIQAVAQAAPDGHKWFFVPKGNITINATLMKDLPFSWERLRAGPYETASTTMLTAPTEARDAVLTRAGVSRVA